MIFCHHSHFTYFLYKYAALSRVCLFHPYKTDIFEFSFLLYYIFFFVMALKGFYRGFYQNAIMYKGLTKDVLTLFEFIYVFIIFHFALGIICHGTQTYTMLALSVMLIHLNQFNSWVDFMFMNLLCIYVQKPSFLFYKTKSSRFSLKAIWCRYLSYFYFLSLCGFMTWFTKPQCVMGLLHRLSFSFCCIVFIYLIHTH